MLKRQLKIEKDLRAIVDANPKLKDHVFLQHLYSTLCNWSFSKRNGKSVVYDYLEAAEIVKLVARDNVDFTNQKLVRDIPEYYFWYIEGDKYQYIDDLLKQRGWIVKEKFARPENN